MKIAGFIVGTMPFINSLYLIATGVLFLIGAFRLNKNLTLTALINIFYGEDESSKKNETNTVIKHTVDTYKVGTELPACEYLLESTSTYASYIKSASDSSGLIESIVFNDNVSTILCFTVHEEEYLKVKGGISYPSSEATSIVQKYIDNEVIFKVGQVIPIEEYKVTPTLGYYEVTSDSTHEFGTIITNENFSESTYISLSDGQYFKVNRATI